MSTGHITKEIAEKFLKDESGVNLREATSIDDDAAEALSKYQGIELWLDGLTDLSHDAEWRVRQDAGNAVGLKNDTTQTFPHHQK